MVHDMRRPTRVSFWTTLWNVAFDNILRLGLPTDVSSICYADYTLLVTVWDSVDQLEAAMNCVLTTVSGFIEEIGLRFAVQKTEAVLCTTRMMYRKPSFELCGVKVEVPQHIQYLGIYLAGAVFPGTPEASDVESRSSYGQT